MHNTGRGVSDGRAGRHVVGAVHFDGEVLVALGICVEGGGPLGAER